MALTECPFMECREIAKYALTGPPDWFSPNVLAVTSWQVLNDGGRAFVAYSSKPYVHIFIIREEGNSEKKQHFTWSFVGQIQPHHEKTSAITFDELLCLVSCGYDGLVRRWKYFHQDWVLESEFNVHSVRENVNPTAVSSFSYSSQSYNFIGTNKGLLIIWIVDFEKSKSHCMSKKYENDSVVVCAWDRLHERTSRCLYIQTIRSIFSVKLFPASTILCS
ncbi:unnamed protein product [Heterobilharzia americana]|nr:unnamed protein product [Heterobilharzia americana]